MKANKNKEKKSFSCFEEIVNNYFPGELKEKKNISADDPKLIGEHSATQALKQLKLS